VALAVAVQSQNSLTNDNGSTSDADEQGDNGENYKTQTRAVNMLQ
jgi:hypothetical protein